VPKQIHVVAESLGKGTHEDMAISQTLYLSCVTPQDAKNIAGDARARKQLDRACPRIVLFTDPRGFRRVLTPLRLKLISHLTSHGTPDSVHQLSRALGRDYHTVLKDVELLAQIGVFSLTKKGPKGGEVPSVKWKEVRMVIAPSLGQMSKLSDIASHTQTKPGAFSMQEWIDALENIEDLRRVVALGRKAYEAHWGDFPRGDDSRVDSWIRIFAVLLNQAFKRLGTDDPEILTELKDCLEWKGRFMEPALWEPAELGGSIHKIAEDLIAAGQKPMLLELLVISHELETHVRPNLVRTWWVAETTTAIQGPKYGDFQLDAQGRQISIGQVLAGLHAWLTHHSSGILSAEDSLHFEELLTNFAGDEVDQVSADDLRNWIAHRDFILFPERVVLSLHPRKKARRLSVEPSTITEWRRFTLSLMSVLYAFQVMFLAHAAAWCGGIEPDLP